MNMLTKIVAAALFALPLSAGAAILNTATNVDATVEVKGSSDSSMNSSARSNGSTNTGVQIHVEAKPVTYTASTTGTEASVTNDADFSLFVKTVKTQDPRVSSIGTSSDGTVNVAYKHDAKLFGFIPVEVTSYTSVNGNGDVSVTMSWWSFLVSGASKIRSDVEALVKGNADVKANAIANASAQSKARLTEAIISSLDAHAAASVETNASAGAAY